MYSWQISQFFLETTVQKTLPDFPSPSQAQLKLLNMGSNPVALSVEGNDVQLPAYQVRLQTKCEKIGIWQFNVEWLQVPQFACFVFPLTV